MTKNFKFELAAKLVDGSDIVLEGDFVIGTPVFVLDADGNKVAIEDNEYQILDGPKFKTEGGLISEIPTEEVVEEAPVVEEVTVEVEAETANVKMISEEEYASLMTTLDELKAKIDSLKEFEESFNLKTEQALAAVELSKVENNVVEDTKKLTYREIILSKLV